MRWDHQDAVWGSQGRFRDAGLAAQVCASAGGYIPGAAPPSSGPALVSAASRQAGWRGDFASSRTGRRRRSARRRHALLRVAQHALHPVGGLKLGLPRLREGRLGADPSLDAHGVLVACRVQH